MLGLAFPALALGESSSVWVKPLSSFVLPGAGQWIDGQYKEAAAFSGIAAGGLVLHSWASDQDEKQHPCYHSERADNQPKQCNPVPERLKDLGVQYYLAAGGMSAYYSFQSALPARQAEGEFAFLKKPDKVDEILTAPFHFSYVTRWTTFVPLLIPLIGFPGSNHVRFDDAALAGMTSYNAGTWEESFFRGYLMPNFTQTMNSPLMGNVTSSAIFGAAHYGKNGSAFPWPQTVIGFYLGWLTQRNDWSIQESIFIHTWWDVFTLVGEYMRNRDDRGMVLQIPLLSTTF